MTLYINNDVSEAIRNASAQTGVEERLLRAFAYVESNFGQNTLSETGVRGLFQITGDTWRSIRKKNSATLGYSEDYNEQAYTAALLIRDLLKKYDNNRSLAAIGYNAGESVATYVQRHGMSNQAIVNAVQQLRSEGVAGFGAGKEQEVINYPVKIANALNESVEIGGDYTINTSVTNAPKQQSYEYDVKKPFLLNVFAGNSEICADLSKIPQGTINESKVVGKIKSYLATRKP